ncbi:MAG: permease-like cell division protein FtsX, partial [Elusimicrobia bacterium]|nr:permease-like cell division protein FtsX [Elusimicrobiota bacterium]
ERHCSRLDAALRDDFRVVLFTRPSLEEARAKVLEEKLRASPEVADVRFISADEALAALKHDDPELAESTALVGDNPLPAAFEVRPAPEALTHLGAWIDAAQRLADWSDLRYKPGQVQAILRLRFYAHLLRMTLSTLLCLIAGIALIALGPLSAEKGKGASSTNASIASALWAAGGGVLGAALALAISWPLHRDELLWAWPRPLAQIALLAACATLGWSLSLWRAES